MKKLTKKQERLLKYNDIITRNKKFFRPGSVFNRDELALFFSLSDIVSKGSYKKVHKANLKLVQLQTEINLLMRENGLYMRSSDYYTKFEVVNKKRTKAAVIRYSAEVDINRYCTTRLEARLKEKENNNNWGTYNKVPVETILSFNNNTSLLSKRHIATIQRMSY